MTKRDSLEKLTKVANVVLDKQLDVLRRSAHARNQSLSALHDLETPPPCSDDDVSAILARHRYAKWAESRRMAINLKLAAQTAEWMQAQQSSALAFGRFKVLSKLGSRL